MSVSDDEDRSRLAQIMLPVERKGDSAPDVVAKPNLCPSPSATERDS